MVQAAPLRPPFPNHTRSPPHPRSHTTAGAHPRVTHGTVRGSFTAPIFARRHTTAGAHPRVTRGTVRGSFTAPIFARRHTTAGAHPRVTRGTVRGSFTAPIFARRHTTAGTHPRVTRGTVRGSFTAPIFARRHTTAGAHPRVTRGTVRGSFTAPIFARRHTTAGAHPRVTRGTVRGSFTAPIFARRHTTAGTHPRVTRGTVRGSFTAPIFARRSALHGDDSACAQRCGSPLQLHKTQDMKTEAGRDAFGYAVEDMLANCTERTKKYDAAGKENLRAAGFQVSDDDVVSLYFTFSIPDASSCHFLVGVLLKQHHKTAGGVIKHNTNAVKSMAATQAFSGDDVDEGRSPEPLAKKAKQPAKPAVGVVPVRGRAGAGARAGCRPAGSRDGRQTAVAVVAAATTRDGA
eukprot:jgi/Tetstr1/449546/TSEL_036634.t2